MKKNFYTLFIMFALVVMLFGTSAKAYDIPINCSNLYPSQVFLINGTAGFDLGDGKQVVYTNCLPNMSINYTTGSDWNILSDQVDWLTKYGVVGNHNNPFFNNSRVYLLNNEYDSSEGDYTLSSNAYVLNRTYGLCGFDNEAMKFTPPNTGYVARYYGYDTGLPTGNASITMCAWIKPKVNLAGAGGLYYGIFGYGVMDVFKMRYVGIVADTGLPIDIPAYQLQIYGEGINTAQLVYNDTWVHICVTTTGLNTTTIYLNGSVSASSPINSYLYNTALHGDDGFMIGIDNTGAAYTGLIQDIMIWNDTKNASFIDGFFKGYFGTEGYGSLGVGESPAPVFNASDYGDYTFCSDATNYTIFCENFSYDVNINNYGWLYADVFNHFYPEPFFNSSIMLNLTNVEITHASQVSFFPNDVSIPDFVNTSFNVNANKVTLSFDFIASNVTGLNWYITQTDLGDLLIGSYNNDGGNISMYNYAGAQYWVIGNVPTDGSSIHVESTIMRNDEWDIPETYPAYNNYCDEYIKVYDDGVLLINTLNNVSGLWAGSIPCYLINNVTFEVWNTGRIPLDNITLWAEPAYELSLNITNCSNRSQNVATTMVRLNDYHSQSGSTSGGFVYFDGLNSSVYVVNMSRNGIFNYEGVTPTFNFSYVNICFDATANETGYIPSVVIDSDVIKQAIVIIAIIALIIFLYFMVPGMNPIVSAIIVILGSAIGSALGWLPVWITLFLVISSVAVVILSLKGSGHNE
jgi:hypothetical protein